MSVKNPALSVAVVSWFDQFLNFALKSPLNSIKSDEPLEIQNKSKIIFLVIDWLKRNGSNSPDVWLGERDHITFFIIDKNSKN